MFASAWRGSRWIACGLGVAALFAAVLMIAPASGTPGSQTAAAAKKCTKAIVGGERVCLRIGDRCKKRYQDDYVDARLSCVKRRLRRAGIAELRGGEPVLLDKNGVLPLKTALAAFDASIAGLPGVNPKKGEIGNVAEAAFVVGALEADIDRLSPQQRAVVEAVTTPAAGAATLPPEGEPRVEPVAVSRSASEPARGGGQGGFTVTNGTLDEQVFALENLRFARDVMRGHGFALLRPITVSFLDTTKIIKGDVALAYVSSADLPPATSQTCNIFVTKDGREAGADTQQLVYAHELAHCAQHGFFSSKAEFRKAPSWVIEGGADWLGGMTVKQLGDEPTDVDWDPWLDEPETDLFERSYSGVGFFAMIHQAGVDGWQRMRDTLFAASGGAAPAFARAIAGLPDVFHDRWGPGLVRDPGLGPEWEYEGPGIPESKPEQLSISGGTTEVMEAAARASAAAALKISAEVLIIKADKSIRGKLNTEGATRKLAKGAYCAKPGGCKCKTQTNLQLPKVGTTAFVGFNDPFTARKVTIQGRTLKDYCKKPSPGPGTGPSCTAKRRGDGASCPVPSAGIAIYDDPESTTPLASFKIGDCTVGSGGFTAISTDGPWRLEVGITNFTGFGSYEIPYGGPDPEVVIDGPGGTRGNLQWQPGGLPFSGAIDFGGDKHHMGLGFIEYRDASGSEASGITGAGGMTCVYPDD